MEQRQPPRIPPEDPRLPSRAAGPAGGPSPGPLALPAPARAPAPSRSSAAMRRRLLLAAGVLGGAILAAYAAHRARPALDSWLGDDPRYQIPFRSIVLEPPPPGWYRGGASAFLDDVRRRSRLPDPVPVLKLQPGELLHAFQLNPWTEAVRIEYPPTGAVVHVRYREPVAVILTQDGDRYLVDGKAVILPSEDLDCKLEEFERRHQLIRIEGRGLAGPDRDTPGLTWEPRPGVVDTAQGNGRILGAVRLARFLRRKMDEAGPSHSPTLRVTHINPMDSDPRENRGLFIYLRSSTCIQWGAAPGDKDEGSPTAEEKWRILLDSQKSGELKPLPSNDFWKIDAAGLTHKHGERRPESARAEGPARDRQTIRATGSGQ
ncbi:MAG: cell division protein FtsQ/DivIB [Isosphaeraceae bacterium]